MMRSGLLTLCILLGLTGTGWTQAPGAFDDVPPWHWAFDGVQTSVQAGIFVGYPASEGDLIANAIAQVYDAFAHASHPAAGAWAARFLTRIPADWPRPVVQSRLHRFALADVRVEIRGEEGTASFVASVGLRRNGAVEQFRAAVHVRTRRGADGRWRIDYATLADGQPQVFK